MRTSTSSVMLRPRKQVEKAILSSYKGKEAVGVPDTGCTTYKDRKSLSLLRSSSKYSPTIMSSFILFVFPLI
jgi:hypothetical protein